MLIFALWMALNHPVALRKESVDRNSKCCFVIPLVVLVALRKESVDRNTDPISLSDIPPNVALRKESVDRNLFRLSKKNRPSVALRKESVDRNSGSAWVQEFPERRSPQGERG